MASDVKQRRTHKELPITDHLDPFSTPNFFFQALCNYPTGIPIILDQLAPSFPTKISETKSCSVCRISSAQWATISCTKPHGHLEEQNHNHAQTSQLSAFVSIFSPSALQRLLQSSHAVVALQATRLVPRYHIILNLSYLDHFQRKPVTMALFQEYQSSELNNLHYRPWSGKSKPINRRNGVKC
ncbi:hypothetical protein E4T38_05347 [Aureobasidium subglaciale]|nr:hypothetical protein E4T38_05347 [Aureobasidium subglaciale]KAI5221789.1 hypothetical protein E4T40_05280 [Aureobasidium subglaciale]KAI5225788.1 hypothetical protein E4T41_05099 [Aureobasidium subglaciale]KAI5261652.1 hypothetical protein E4T46_04992 [Aureobasidium subglaciale]